MADMVPFVKDIMATRQTGFALLAESSVVQQVMELIIRSTLLSVKKHFK